MVVFLLSSLKEEKNLKGEKKMKMGKRSVLIFWLISICVLITISLLANTALEKNQEKVQEEVLRKKAENVQTILNTGIMRVWPDPPYEYQVSDEAHELQINDLKVRLKLEVEKEERPHLVLENRKYTDSHFQNSLAINTTLRVFFKGRNFTLKIIDYGSDGIPDKARIYGPKGMGGAFGESVRILYDYFINALVASMDVNRPVPDDITAAIHKGHFMLPETELEIEKLFQKAIKENYPMSTEEIERLFQETIKEN